ncbi:MAG: 1-deoxy-D-xylulose-5-phosphate reductoisomerase [Pseudomonadota bacterium]
MSDPQPQGVAILGSTGSIGESTLDVVRRHPERFRITALSANRQLDKLYGQCLEYRPDYAVMADADCALELRTRLRTKGLNTEVLSGEQSLSEIAADPRSPIVMAAIVGAAGLISTLAAARAGKRLLLANKEALVMSGRLLLAAALESGATLLPIDSEHNAIFQCLPQSTVGAHLNGVKKILLTASGGPFRDFPSEALENVTPEQACAHPNWQMGRKISVDSATLMNKGLEVIEACWLFDVTIDAIEVVLHPQSIVHSMVSYADGSVLAQMGNPDMRTPIAHAMAWPERIESGVASLDVTRMGDLTFGEPDTQRFPCLNLATCAMQRGGSAPAVLNAANEEAVAAFLAGQLGFTQIPSVIDATLTSLDAAAADTLEEILAIDAQARTVAQENIRNHCKVVA